MPDFSTPSRRQGKITVQITNRRGPGPLNLLVDSTGIKFLGDGEWLARKQGRHRRRRYRKVHLAMDTATGDIPAVEFTSSREGDGAFGTRRCHSAILDRGGTAIIPTRRNGRLWKEACPAARAATISCTRPDALGDQSGSNGLAIMIEVALRPK